MFNDFDRNGSGKLDYKELRNALSVYGVNVDAEGAKEVLLAYDDEPDGVLELKEFTKLVEDIESGATLPAEAVGMASSGKASGGVSKTSGGKAKVDPLRSSRIRPVESQRDGRRDDGRRDGGRRDERDDRTADDSRRRDGAVELERAYRDNYSPDGDTWAGRAPLRQSLNRRDLAPRSSAAHYGLPRSDSFVSLSSEDDERGQRRGGGGGGGGMELPKLQYVSHELGLSSHGTRSQLLERLDAHLSEEGRYLDVPLVEAVDRLYLKLVRGSPGEAGFTETRPFDDVLRSGGRWSSQRDRTGPYRRVGELGGLVPNGTQRVMLPHPGMTGTY